MTASTLNALKGWPQPAAVDFETQLDASVPEANLPVPEGSVVHVNASGKYELGVGTTKVMPLFLFQASDDPDVANDGGDASTDRGVWVGITPSGAIMALVAVGAYELVSTAFVDGDNVLAVEVHQASHESPDVSFDLQLTATVVPEPSTLVLTAIGLFALLAYGWRRKKA